LIPHHEGEEERSGSSFRRMIITLAPAAHM
jgi:hypothetical protein